MIRDGRLAPLRLMVVVHVPNVVTLKNRPGMCQGCTGIFESLPKYTIASPMAFCKVLIFLLMSLIMRDHFLKSRARDYVPITSLAKFYAADVDLSSEIVWFCPVEIGQINQQRLPEYEGVRLDEDIPFLVWIFMQSPVDHRKKFELVQLPRYRLLVLSRDVCGP